MAINFTNFGSEIFTFEIGKDAEKFHVHGQAVARLSHPLDIVINRPWAEKETKTVRFEDITPETFRRLCEFAYSGDYTSPEPKQRKRPIQETPTQPQDTAEFHWGDWGSAPQKSKIKKKKKELAFSMANLAKPGSVRAEGEGIESTRNEQPETALADALNPCEGMELRTASNDMCIHDTQTIGDVFRGDFQYNPPISANQFAQVCSVRSNTPEEDFEEILLAHGQLYVFALEQMIDSLCKLCLYKIHTILTSYEVTGATILDVFALGRYIFDHESTKESDDLKVMIVHFICWRIRDDSVGGRREFLDLMNEGGLLARAIMQHIFWRRLAN